MPRAAQITPASPADAPAARSAHAAATLRDLLITGVLAPGQQLSEIAVAERLGISRNTLREVFRLLAHEGLLEHRPHRGVFVTEPTPESIRDIYVFRRIVEVGALARALPGHPAGAAMAQAVADSRVAVAAEDWAALGTANMAFHAAIVSLTDSARTMAAYNNVAAELRLAFLGHHDPHFLHTPYVDLNAAILDAYLAGESHTAAALLEEYLIRSERTLLSVHSRLR